MKCCNAEMQCLENVFKYFTLGTICKEISIFKLM